MTSCYYSVLNPGVKDFYIFIQNKLQQILLKPLMYSAVHKQHSLKKYYDAVTFYYKIF